MIITPTQKKFLKDASPIFAKPRLTKEQKKLIKPFVSNINGNPYTINLLSPETIAAVCSRSSRVIGDLRETLAKEYVEPYIQQNNKHGRSMKGFVNFLQQNSIYDIFANPKARQFFIKWLAQYGDDSIAQMAGVTVVYPALSQIGIKHIQNLRQGAAFLEQSTRYVNFNQKVQNSYKYYTDQNLKKMGLQTKYKHALDNLFTTYTLLNNKLVKILQKKYPTENPKILNAYIFDNIRSLLPVAGLSQVTMFASGQTIEYLIGKSLKHNLSEIKWLGLATYKELNKTIPSFLTRIDSDNSIKYQNYLTSKDENIKNLISSNYPELLKTQKEQMSFKVIEYDKNGENKIIAALLYKEGFASFSTVFKKVEALTKKRKEQILQSILKSREARWYKLPRAFEYANVTYEMVSDFGTYKDLQRHRIKSQIRTNFSPHLGYKIPPLILDEKLDKEFISAINTVENVYSLIEKKDKSIAQYATCVAHNLRYLINTNLRALIWESELRSISQGHFDYRQMAQMVAKWVQSTYPLIGKYLIVDFNNYLMARRGTTEKIEKKEQYLKQTLL